MKEKGRRKNQTKIPGTGAAKKKRRRKERKEKERAERERNEGGHAGDGGNYAISQPGGRGTGSKPLGVLHLGHGGPGGDRPWGT